MDCRRSKQGYCEPMEPRRLLSGLGFADPFHISPVDAPDFITAGDFDSDGKVDLVTSSFAASGLTVLRGTGKGGFKSSGSIDLAAAPDSLRRRMSTAIRS